MQRLGKIIKQINRRQIMETETFECSFKRAFEKDDGGVTVYVTKDDGTDMTIYGEAERCKIKDCSSASKNQ